MTTPGAHTRPLRVAMVIDRYPPEFTGAGRQLATLAPHLAALGCSITVVTGSPGCGDENDPLPVVRIPVPDGPGRDQAFSKGVRKWLRAHRRRIDIVHAHGTSRATVQALIAGTVMRKATLLKFTMAGGDCPAAIAASRFGKQKLQVLRRMVRGFIAPSTAIAKSCRTHRFAAAKIHTIPNGVDVSHFRPLPDGERHTARAAHRQEQGWPEDGPLVVFLGSIEPRKGVDLLPDAWAAVLKVLPEARLVLVGPTLETNSAFAEELAEAFAPNSDAVRFAGPTESPHRWLQAADLFVFPSRSEGLPNALIEAQACGVPAVATRLPGVTEDVVADGETGLIIAQDDSAALAAAILTILGDPGRRNAMAEAAAARAREHFALEEVARRYVALYRKLLKRPEPVESVA